MPIPKTKRPTRSKTHAAKSSRPCVIYYYSGTGNSLWAARALAARLPGARCVSMSPGGEGFAPEPGAAVGFVFPVHIWGLPHRVIRLLSRLALTPDQYCFAVAVNAGQVAATLLQLRKLFDRRGLSLAAGYSLEMPSNYLPWGEAVSEPERSAVFARAEEKIILIGEALGRRESHPPEKGPLWQNVLFTGIYQLSFAAIPRMDKDFSVDARCNGCGICVRICPAANVRLEDKRPVWAHRCEQCLACLHWCPQAAIQMGKKTPAYHRYHHPQVRLQDLLPAAKRPNRGAR